jgi:hypothetical protein
MGGDHGVLPRLHAVRPLGRCLGGYRSRRRAGVLRGGGVSLAAGRGGPPDTDREPTGRVRGPQVAWVPRLRLRTIRKTEALYAR